MATTNENDQPEKGGLTDLAAVAVKQRVGLWLVGLLTPFIIPILIVLVVIGMAMSLAGALPSAGGAPSGLAQTLIPPHMLALYRSNLVKQECPGLSWTIIAAIHHLESNDGRNPGISTAGAMGTSQFLPSTWDSQSRPVVDVGAPYGRIPDGKGYGLDGNGDGKADIMSAADSVPAAARYLCANGGGDPRTLPNAIYAYNHAWWYVYGGISDGGTAFEGVIPLAKKLEATLTTTAGCNGQVEVASYANLPGRPIQPETMSFLCLVANIHGRQIVVTTGTNHSKHTVDGGVSDHYSGHGADFGMSANGGYNDSPVGDSIAAACLIAGGYPATLALLEARQGGLWTLNRYGLRIQCIWKTYAGGNHHNHVHIGANPD